MYFSHFVVTLSCFIATFRISPDFPTLIIKMTLLMANAILVDPVDYHEQQINDVTDSGRFSLRPVLQSSRV